MIMQKKKEYVLYSNYDIYNKEAMEYAKGNLLENGVEESEITEDMLFDECRAIDEDNWIYFQEDIKHLFNGDSYVLTGTCGLWDGTHDGGMIVRYLQDVLDCLSDCDYIKFEDVNGHLKIQGTHHDGTNYFELRKLTEKGERFLDNHAWSNRRFVCETTFNSSTYSKLPRAYEKMYLS